MKHWPTKRLLEIAAIQMGQSPPGETYNSDGDGLPFFQGKTEFGDEYPTVVKWCSQPSRIAEAGDILLSVRAPVGPTNFATERCCIGRGLAAIRVKPEHGNQRYIRYYLKRFETEIAARGVGSTFTAINRNDIERFELVVPSLSEQERIVMLLDEADSLRKLRADADRRIAKLIPALFHEMFGNPERNPKKWPTKAVSNVCTLVRGSSPRPKSDPRYYGGPIPRLMISDITRDGWSVTPRVDSLTKLGATMSRSVKAGTIVMAASGNVGLCAQLAVDACVHDGFVAFNDLDTSSYLPLFFGMAIGQMREVHLRNKAGAIFQNITTTDVKAMKILAPPLQLQNEFVLRVTEIREMEAGQAASRKRLEELFQSMLHRAFEGEL